MKFLCPSSIDYQDWIAALSLASKIIATPKRERRISKDFSLSNVQALAQSLPRVTTAPTQRPVRSYTDVPPRTQSSIDGAMRTSLDGGKSSQSSVQRPVQQPPVSVPIQRPTSPIVRSSSPLAQPPMKATEEDQLSFEESDDEKPLRRTKNVHRFLGTETVPIPPSKD